MVKKSVLDDLVGKYILARKNKENNKAIYGKLADCDNSFIKLGPAIIFSVEEQWSRSSNPSDEIKEKHYSYQPTKKVLLINYFKDLNRLHLALRVIDAHSDWTIKKNKIDEIIPYEYNLDTIVQEEVSSYLATIKEDGTKVYDDRKRIKLKEIIDKI